MHFASSFILTYGLIASVVSPMRVSIYQGPACRSASVGSVEVNAGDGCRIDHVGVGTSMVFITDDESDGEAEDLSPSEKAQPYMLMLFSSDDCNPATIISNVSFGCASDHDSKSYRSFEIWDVMND